MCSAQGTWAKTIFTVILLLCLLTLASPHKLSLLMTKVVTVVDLYTHKRKVLQVGNRGEFVST